MLQLFENQSWMLRPPVLVGETVGYDVNGFSQGGSLGLAEMRVGTVRWMGRLKELHGQEMVVGLEMVRHKDWLKIS